MSSLKSLLSGSELFAVEQFEILQKENEGLKAEIERLKSTEGAFEQLKADILVDDEIAYGWHSNIAMQFYDELQRKTALSHEFALKISNHAASNFMSIMFEAKTSQNMLHEVSE